MTDVLELKVVRQLGTKGFTAGRLYCNGKPFCYTLEDEVREVKGTPVSEWKIKGETAIPEGRYRIILTKSPRFKRVLPEVLNVPGYTAIRIHSGNKASHTEGCLLVGLSDGNPNDGWLGNSRKAEDMLVSKINETINSGEMVWIEYVSA